MQVFLEVFFGILASVAAVVAAICWIGFLIGLSEVIRRGMEGGK